MAQAQFNRSPQGNNRSAPHTGRPEAPPIPLNDIVLGDSISDELYAGIAEGKARFLADNSGQSNKPTQLRRFYDELCMWQDKVATGASQEERAARYRECAPLIKMLNAKVEYAKGRQHVDENYVRLLRHLIGQVKSPRTLDQAKLFLEAFMGFYKAFRPKD